MAAATVLPAMNGNGGPGIHPFFRATNGYHDEPQNGPSDPVVAESDAFAQLDGTQDGKPKAKRGRKPKAPPEEEVKGKKQKTLQDLVNPKGKAEHAEGGTVDNAIDIVSSDPAAETSRRKRRRTSQYESREVGDEPATANSTSDAAVRPSSPAPQINLPATAAQHQALTFAQRPEIANSTSDAATRLSSPAPQELLPAPSAQHRPRRFAQRPEIANSTSDAARRLSSPEPLEVIEPLQRRTSSPQVIIPRSSPLPQRDLPEDPADDVIERLRTPPKKQLRLNNHGKFSSPVSKKPKDEPAQASPGAPKRRGRPRKAKEAVEPKQLLAVLSYAHDEARRDRVGAKIDRMMSGEERVSIAANEKKTTPRKLRTPRKSNRPTHPFFVGKPEKQAPAMKIDSPRKASATTPGKLKRQIFGDRVPDVPKEVPYAVGSNLLKDRMMVKHPGAREPAWPDREQGHVRGLDSDESEKLIQGQNFLAGRKRKRKAARLPFPQDESILRSFGANLVPEPECRVRLDGLNEPHHALRVPERLLITGYDIRQRIAPELRCALRDDADDEPGLPSSSQLSTHLALRNLWNRIPSTLSAFDELKGENMSWTQKYAPNAADQVLQPAHEMRVLRDWLTSLTVSAVEGTHPAHLKPAIKPEVKPRKKRRRKHDDMDDFLVDSDEEMRDMDELTDPEDIASIFGSKTQKSVVQAAIEGTKLSNAVLLSGPSGCGKTAAAYAVAKELGFKVFEISSSERRSGKDVLDKIGDMTENHLVKHHGIDAGELSATEDANKERLDEAFQRDLASGRQGKMAAFFKPNGTAKPAASKPKPAVKAKTLKAVEQALKKPPKDQQQSLILLEEVDVLFREDKEFWNTVFKLIVSSKRPFIMTCNDEDLVPLQAMNLHAILRFSPPAQELAVDYMLLLAATEGHLLERDAVASLYEAKGRDLRASLAELDFWCQMAVGDPKGGLGWLYQRWPLGSDVDGAGRKVRVVSEGTYRGGMGASTDQQLSDHERLMWDWRESGLDPMNALNSTNAIVEDGNPDDEQRLASLKQHAAFSASLSAVDVFSKPGLPETAALEMTLPEMTDKARNQYIEGMHLLQTDERVDHEDLSMQLVVSSARSLSKISGRSLASTTRTSTSYTYKPPLTRAAFAVFDSISTASESFLSAGPGITQSAFDGPLSIIATDLAPYVRSIVHYDIALEEQRERLSSVMTEGEGRRAKRARTTRAARSALEGSQRASTRRERWFGKELDLRGVIGTEGEGWAEAVGNWGGVGMEGESVEGSEEVASSAEGG